MFKFVLCLIPLLMSCAMAAETSKDAAPWNFDTPELWAESYPECGGERNSPINLSGSSTVECASDAPFIFNDGGCKVGNLKASAKDAVWGDVTVENCKPSFKHGDKTYNFLGVHIHSISEHTVSGGHYAAELHMVHVNANDATDFKVLGLFLQVQPTLNQAANELLGPILDRISAAADAIIDKNTDYGAAYDIYALVPADTAHFTYAGSLTTPPCSELVTWVVFEQAVKFNYDQLKQYRDGAASVEGSLVSRQGHNNRPVQPLNGRKVQFCA